MLEQPRSGFGALCAPVTWSQSRSHRRRNAPGAPAANALGLVRGRISLAARFNQNSNTRSSARHAPKLCRSSSANWEAIGDSAMPGRLLAAMSCLSFLLLTAAPREAMARDERPVPPLPIGPRQATASDHARELSEMADRAANISARCQSSGAALGSQAYKKCRALLEDKMSIENDVPRDRSYLSTRSR
jgi:hypothetical protein